MALSGVVLTITTNAFVPCVWVELRSTKFQINIKVQLKATLEFCTSAR